MAKAKYSASALLVCVSLILAACSSSPTGPTTLTAKPALRELDYDINIPDITTTLALQRAYPNGTQTPPVIAQGRWNYTAAYGGSPNVYYGEIAPKCEYFRVGIVVAPYRVASMETFTSSDWPGVLEAGVTYTWVGRFVFAKVAPPNSYTYDPTALCSAPRSS